MVALIALAQLGLLWIILGAPLEAVARDHFRYVYGRLSAPPGGAAPRRGPTGRGARGATREGAVAQGAREIRPRAVLNRDHEDQQIICEIIRGANRHSGAPVARRAVCRTAEPVARCVPPITSRSR